MKPINNPEEFINRRRRQMHVHSIIYYHMHTSILPDALFDQWAVELANAQKEYPQFKHTGYMPGVFANWTGDTGMHLPTTDAAYGLAERLIESARKRNAPVSVIAKVQAASASAKASKLKWEGDVGYEVNS